MAKSDVSAAIAWLKALLSGDDDFVRDAVRVYLQDVLEEEMTSAIGAGNRTHLRRDCSHREGPLPSSAHDDPVDCEHCQLSSAVWHTVAPADDGRIQAVG